jgi:hypothetical protein
MSNDIELNKNKISISRHNLLSWRTPPNSPNNKHSLISTEDTDITSTGEIPNETLHDDKCIHKSYKNRLHNNYVRIPLHLILHITLLSIFEIFLFFSFVVDMERNAFLLKLKSYFNSHDEFSINENNAEYLNQELNSPESMAYYDTLKTKNDKSIIEYEEYNQKLQSLAYYGTICLGCSFILYVSCTFMFYKLSLKKLIVEHAVLIVLIGIYEYWFFMNIILPYKIISADELNYITVSCMLKKINGDIDGIDINSNITSACNLI